MATRIRLGELLVRAGVIDDMQLKAALAEQHRWGGRLGRILVDMSFVSEDILVKALSKQLGVERADLSRVFVPKPVMDKISVDFAQTNALCPVRYDEGRRSLLVATADPTNVTALDELRFKTGLRIETALAGEHEIHNAIQRYMRAVDGVGIDLPDAIDLGEESGEPVFMQNDDYSAAMAASGMAVSSTRPGTGVQTPQNNLRQGSVVPAPWSAQEEPATPFAVPTPPPSPPVAQPQAVPSSPPTPSPPPPVAAAPAPAPASPGSALHMAQRLEGAQKQQHKALRVMVELLIEKGVISRDEYFARVAPKR